jgi:tripartite-type tricarboxylate transporter receptor subunit TctC
MRNFILGIVMIITTYMSPGAFAQETIEWVHAHGPASATTPVYMAVIEEANRMQKKYLFVNQFKPGGDGVVATNYVEERPGSRLTSTTGAVADGFITGRIDSTKYRPVQGLGDLCWAAASLVPLTEQKGQPVMASASSQGSLGHYMALALADRYKFDLTMVYFKSNAEGFLNMAANNGVQLAADRPRTIEAFINKNPKIELLTLHCPIRHPKYPNLKTFSELGISLPPASVTVIGHVDMDLRRSQEIGQIFADAIRAVGNDRFWDMADMRSPVFAGISTEAYHANHMNGLKTAQVKFAQSMLKAK